MKKTQIALITLTTITLCAGCGSKAAARGGSQADARGSYSGVTAQAADTEEVTDDMQDLPDTDGTELPVERQDADGAELLIDRPNPEIEVTAEEFEDRMGYTLSVPAGADEVTYIIDTDSNVGFMGFYLDGVLWNAKVFKTDTFVDIDSPYVTDNMTKIRCDFENEPFMKLRGVDPLVRAYRIQYTEDWEAYLYYATWFMEDEGYVLSLTNYAETPVDSMPVEVFE